MSVIEWILLISSIISLCCIVVIFMLIFVWKDDMKALQDRYTDLANENQKIKDQLEELKNEKDNIPDYEKLNSRL